MVDPPATTAARGDSRRRRPARRGRPSATSRALAERHRRHRVEGAQQQRQPPPGDARPGDRASPRRLGFRPNDLAQSLHRGKTFTVGLISNDCFGRFTMPIMEGLEECLADSRIAVFMCNATDDPEREAPACRAADRQARRRHRGDGAARRPAPAAQVPVARPAGDLRLLAGRRSATPTACCPTTKAARRSPSSTSSGSAAGASPMSPGRSGSRRCGSAATATARRSPRAGLAETDGFYLPGVWSEGWGREAVAAALPTAAARRPTRSSAATTRSRAAPPMRCASAASSCRTRCRSSASTTGRSWPRRRGRR